MTDNQTPPTRPGFYWAQWLIAEDGTEAEVPYPPRWDVVDVYDEGIDPAHPALRAMVPGEGHSQSIGNFAWGPGPLEPPVGDP